MAYISQESKDYIGKAVRAAVRGLDCCGDKVAQEASDYAINAFAPNRYRHITDLQSFKAYCLPMLRDIEYYLQVDMSEIRADLDLITV